MLDDRQTVLLDRKADCERRLESETQKALTAANVDVLKQDLAQISDPGPPRKRIRPRLGFLERGVETELLDEQVAVGQKSIRVHSTEGLAVGDTIVIEPHPNRSWSQALNLEREWGDDTMYLQYEREITAIDGQRLTLNAPLLHFIDNAHFERVVVWQAFDRTRIERVGVEHLRLIARDGEDAVTSHDHARDGVLIDRARDGWVRNITAERFTFAAVVLQYGARNITVQDCASMRPMGPFAGGRRYAFHVNGALNLVQRCYVRGARHAFSSSSRAPGPNVFLDCLSEKSGYGSDIGPHAKWATGYLYDNIIAPRGTIQVQNQGGNHGWRGVNQVLWNCRAARIVCDQPPTADRNWSIGSVATRLAGNRPSPPGIWLSPGRHVQPRSLYLAQLAERRGAAAVAAVTLPLQREESAEAVEAYLRDTFAELNDRERFHQRNLLLDPDFESTGRRSAWRILHTVEGEDIEEPPDRLKRKENPVFGDRSALAVPEGALLLASWRQYLEIPVRHASRYRYRLSFDYHAPEDAEVSLLIDYRHIKYGPENVKDWHDSETLRTDPAPGGAAWRHYTFEFTLPVTLDQYGMPYPQLVRLRFLRTAGYLLANPYLELLGTEP